MKILAALVGAFAVVALSLATASAAPTFVQTPACGTSATTIVFGVGPTNGNIVSGVSINNQTFSLFTDSNAVSYPTQTSTTTTSGGQSAWSSIFDNVVAGSPTATYTFSQSGVNCAYEIAGSALPATYANNSTLNSTGTLVATIAGVKAGDLLICGVWGGNGSTTSVAVSNGTYTSDQTAFSQFFIGHATATSTASTTCTAQVTATFGALVVFADYTAAAAGSGATGNGPNPAGAIGTGAGTGATGNGRSAGAAGNG